MYVENNTGGCLRNHCCHSNATVPYISSVFGVDVAVTVTMEMQQWVPFAPLPNYKIFRTAVNNRKYSTLSACVRIFALVLQNANRIFSAPYYNLWPVQLYHIFPHYLINGTILKKKILTQNACRDFLYNFCLQYYPLQEDFGKILS
jgi:hypothetical protein